MEGLALGVLIGIALPLLIAPVAVEKLRRTRGWDAAFGLWWSLCLLTIPAAVAVAWVVHLVIR